MRRRRLEVKSLMEPDEIFLTIPNFPRLGCCSFTYPELTPKPTEDISQSLFFPDGAINAKHPRYKHLTSSIRLRHEGKVTMNVPIFKDINTPTPFVEDFSLLGFGNVDEATASAKSDHIYMDAIGFGDSCCCLQVTIQGANLDEARWIYDQLTPLTPVMLALSAGTPIWRGYLADTDSRWNIISIADDDRTKEERGLKPLIHDKFVLPKSRYDSTDCYIHPCSAPLNDVKLQYEEKHFQELIDEGIDKELAAHMAHMFVKDPLIVCKETLEKEDEHSNELLDSIITTIWTNIRFKPPPISDHSIGWRVEFRPMEVQLSDFENAAYACFVVLMSRVILSFRLSFLIPISEVNENMQIAQRRDAVLNEKLTFRRGLHTCNHVSPQPTNANVSTCSAPPSADFIKMSLAEIINGKEDEFPGLVPLCRQYLDSIDVDVDTRYTIEQYLGFIEKRATGEIWTLARWVRSFVTQHPKYKRDSVVTDEITYDMVTLMNDIATGKSHCDKLLGKHHIEPIDALF